MTKKILSYYAKGYVVLYYCLNVLAISEDKVDYIKGRFYEEIERLFDQLSVYHTQILLGNFNAKLGRGNIFQQKIGNEFVHPERNDRGIRLVNFATSKNLLINRTTFPHCNIHKCSWTSADSIAHNRIDHFLVDKKRQLSIIDIKRSYCDTDH
jgi:hypothetical protein